MNRRAFLAGLLAATSRCSFGVALPGVRVAEANPVMLYVTGLESCDPLAVYELHPDGTPGECIYRRAVDKSESSAEIITYARGQDLRIVVRNPNKP